MPWISRHVLIKGSSSNTLHRGHACGVILVPRIELENIAEETLTSVLIDLIEESSSNTLHRGYPRGVLLVLRIRRLGRGRKEDSVLVHRSLIARFNI